MQIEHPTLEDFYRAILPNGNVLGAIMRPGKGQPMQIHGFADADALTNKLTPHRDKHSSYHCLGMYDGLSIGRLKDEYTDGKKTRGALEGLPEAQGVAFGFDLDVGPAKFKDLREASDAINGLVQGGMPEPGWVVATGGGLQFYFVLTKALNEELWTRLFQRLTAAIHHLLDKRSDKSVGNTLHSWLRSPCTLNHKYDPPRSTQILFGSTTTHSPKVLNAWAKSIDAPKPKSAAKTSFERTESTVSVGERLSTEEIAIACPFFRHQVDTQGASTCEPDWLMTANLCAHTLGSLDTFLELSSGHPDYDEEEATAKFMHAKNNVSAGPWGCDRVTDSSKCQDCWASNRPEVPNPISAARYWSKHGAQVFKITPVTAENVDTEADPKLDEDEVYADDSEGVNFAFENDVPDEIEKLFTQRGMVIVPKGEDSVEFPRIRTGGGIAGELLMFSNRSETIGLSDNYLTVGRPFANKIQMPMSLTANPNELATFLCSKGFYVENGIEMASFARAMLAGQNTTRMAERFGWIELGNDRDFVLPGGTASGQTIQFNPAMTNLNARLGGSRGDIDGWVHAIGHYASKEQEPYLVALLASLASPLVHENKGHECSVLALCGAPGTGKTSAQQVALSVWGKPERANAQFKDTTNALYKAMGTLNNLPVVVDELTHQSSEKLYDMVFDVTSGQEKQRLSRDANFRELQTWQTILITSGNASLKALISENTMGKGAQLDRIFEIDIPPQTPVALEAGKLMMAGVEQNYGLFGAEFIKKLLKLGPKRVLTKANELLANVGITSGGRERFNTQMAKLCVAAHIVACKTHPDFPGRPQLTARWFRNTSLMNMQANRHLETSAHLDVSELILSAETTGSVFVSRDNAINTTNYKAPLVFIRGQDVFLNHAELPIALRTNKRARVDATIEHWGSTSQIVANKTGELVRRIRINGAGLKDTRVRVLQVHPDIGGTLLKSLTLGGDTATDAHTEKVVSITKGRRKK